MDPAKVGPSDLPLDRVELLHSTGTSHEVSDLSAWEGVPLCALLAKAKARPDFINITFTGYDGCPVRLVAEDLFGGRWVKWLKEIRVE